MSAEVLATVRLASVATMRTFGAAAFVPIAITWNSTIFTPSAGMTTEVRNGAQTRSVQNEPIHRLGKPALARTSLLRAAPVTTRRYFMVPATEPGNSGPVHGASESDGGAPGTTPSATAPSCACSMYHCARGSVAEIC